MLNKLFVLVVGLFVAGCGGAESTKSAKPTNSEPATPHATPRTAETSASTDKERVVLKAISVVLPDGWIQRPATSPMRVAEFNIGDAELVVFHFEGGGSVEANLERWHGQFKQADGAKSSDRAKVVKKTVTGLSITTTDLGGRYVAAVRPGSETKHDKANHHMLAAIVETSGGSYYFKLLGPSKDVVAVRDAFHSMLDSVKAEGSATSEPTNPHGGW